MLMTCSILTIRTMTITTTTNNNENDPSSRESNRNNKKTNGITNDRCHTTTTDNNDSTANHERHSGRCLLGILLVRFKGRGIILEVQGLQCRPLTSFEFLLRG